MTRLEDHDFETLVIDRETEHIAQVTLNRPERLNALSIEMFEDLHSLTALSAADDALRCLVLTGAGRGFCAGVDYTTAAAIPDMSVTEMFAIQERGAAAIAAIRGMPVPVVAAVNGPAAGGGLALALTSDVRLASPEAVFANAFIKLGLTGCDVGVSWLLPRIVGYGHASELMLTGRRLAATEAERIGLVNKVVPASELLRAAHRVASEIAENSRFGVALTKQGLQFAVDAPSLEAAIAMENRGQVLASRTAEMAEMAARVTGGSA